MLVRRLPARRVRRAQAARRSGTGVTDTVEGRRDARVVAVTSGGTIPDRGLFPVFLEGEPGHARAGASASSTRRWSTSSAPGCTATSWSSARARWRVAEISPNRVIVDAGAGRARQAAVLEGRRRRAAGRARSGDGRLHARDRGRPGARARRGGARRAARLRKDHDLDALAAENLLAYLEDEREATGRPAHGPADRRGAVPRRARRLAARRPDAVRRPGPRPVDDGARGAAPGAARARGPDDLVRRRHRDPPARGRGDQPRRRRGAAVPGARGGRGPGGRARRRSRACSRAGSARTRRGRCCCRDGGPARGRRCGSSASGRRTCWRSRSRYGSFPILVETYRECLADVFDLAALREILGGVRAARDRGPQRRDARAPRRSRARCCSTTSPPTCTRATRRWPSGGRRRLALDRDLLRELLGQEELRELLDADALADLELSLQALADERHAHDPRPGPRPAAAARRPVDRRGRGPDRRRACPRPRSTSPSSRRSRRAVRARIGGEERWIAMEDVARYRDGVGVVGAAGRAAGVPRAGGRGARGAARPLRADARAVPRRRAGAPLGAARSAWSRTRSSAWSPPGSLLRGEFRPGGAERE